VGTKEGDEFIIPVVPLTQILSSFITHFAAPSVFAKLSTISTESFSLLKHKHTGQDSELIYIYFVSE